MSDWDDERLAHLPGDVTYSHFQDSEHWLVISTEYSFSRHCSRIIFSDVGAIGTLSIDSACLDRSFGAAE